MDPMANMGPMASMAPWPMAPMDTIGPKPPGFPFGPHVAREYCMMHHAIVASMKLVLHDIGSL